MSESDASGRAVKRELFFPTYIYFRDLPSAGQLNSVLKRNIYLLREEDSVGLHRSNVKQTGAWHSQLDLNQRSEFAALVNEILRVAQEVFSDLRYDPQYQPKVDNMWANVSPRHAFNRMHVHPGVIWSGVYYVQAPENSGRIYFSDPRVQAQMLRPRISAEGGKLAHNWSEVYYEPIEGRLILFPAWLLHEVEPNLSDAEGEAANRISISFNILQTRKQRDD